MMTRVPQHVDMANRKRKREPKDSGSGNMMESLTCLFPLTMGSTSCFPMPPIPISGSNFLSELSYPRKPGRGRMKETKSSRNGNIEESN
ncbi:hypothetical protein U9M48_032613 [Paspalum notatum var. saurae]|uniref:Uncharacterized protein n=1 Tax=Paspalum notatum var. saurae TaxID=547442 RepID=A0AAQ3X4Q1_PASNO